MSATLSKQETWSLLGLFVACIAVIANTFQGDGEPLIASLAFSGIAFASSYSMIRWLGPVFMKAGLKGKDMSKVRKVEMYVKASYQLNNMLTHGQLQTRRHGCYLCCRLSAYYHHLHSISVLQGHRGCNLGWWAPR